MFSEFEKLLREAGMPDLAARVCIDSVHDIINSTMCRFKFTKELEDWYRRFNEPNQPSDAEVPY